MARKRIIVVEDEVDMAELVALRLSREGYQVDVATDGLKGWDMIRSDPPDLAVLDIMLPGMNGNEITKELRNDPRTSTIPVIMLTAKGEESDIVVGLQFGADDYVTKPFSMSVLVARIAALLRRSNTSDTQANAVVQVGCIRIDQKRHHVDIDGNPISLTLTEFRLLAALAAARGRVLSRNQLIDQAVGMDAIVTDRTIDVHLTALRRKLGEARKYIETVRGVGYRLAMSSDETT